MRRGGTRARDRGHLEAAPRVGALLPRPGRRGAGRLRRGGPRGLPRQAAPGRRRTRSSTAPWSSASCRTRRRGLALARELRARGRAQGLPDVAQECGIVLAYCYVQQGRLDEADLLLSELVDEGMPRTTTAGGPPGHGCSCSGATPREPCLWSVRPTQMWGSVAVLPDWEQVIHHVRVLDADGLPDEAVGITREYMRVYRRHGQSLRPGGYRAARLPRTGHRPARRTAARPRGAEPGRRDAGSGDRSR